MTGKNAQKGSRQDASPAVNQGLLAAESLTAAAAAGPGGRPDGQKALQHSSFLRRGHPADLLIAGTTQEVNSETSNNCNGKQYPWEMVMKFNQYPLYKCTSGKYTPASVEPAGPLISAQHLFWLMIIAYIKYNMRFVHLLLNVRKNHTAGIQSALG